MRVLVAGAGGVIGQRLVPLLQSRGYEVAALTRSEGKRRVLETMGATVFVADALQVASVMQAVESYKPEIVVNQLTAIPERLDLRKYDQQMEPTARLRSEGVDNLIAAAKRAGVRRFISESFAGLTYPHTGDRVKAEDSPLDPDPPQPLRRTLDALRHLESAVTANFPRDGVVLRYGCFYGAGTAIARDGVMVEAVKKRMLPIVAGGTGVWSFLHADDAAAATVAALDAPAGVYNIADDEPATTREWITFLAQILGAKSPREVPGWIARWVIGEHGVGMMRDNRGLLNKKAKQSFGWMPRYPSWRDGFQAELGAGNQNL